MLSPTFSRLPPQCTSPERCTLCSAVWRQTCATRTQSNPTGKNLRRVFTYREVELQCRFSLFGSCLSGDVHWGGNLEKCATKFTQNATQCFPRIARRLCCTRLAPIFDIAEVELQCGFSVFGSCLSGDVHWGGNLEKWATTFTQNATQCFPRIARRLCCTRLAPISDVPEVELQCGFSLYGSCLSGDVHWGGNVEKVDIYTKCDAMFSQDCTALRWRTLVIHFRYTGSGIRMSY